MIRQSVIGLLLLAFAACSTVSTGKDPESLAQRHVRLAERFERGFLFREATREYSLVAQYYPTTTVYPSAVLHLALLYGNQANTVRNDSLALRWIKVYLALPLGRDDRENAQLYYSLMERIATLEQELLRQDSAFDSLATSSQRLGTLVPGQTRRIQELESEVQRMSDELKRLKEVDIRTSKRGMR